MHFAFLGMQGPRAETGHPKLPCKIVTAIHHDTLSKACLRKPWARIREASCHQAPHSLVAIDLLALFVALLRFHGKGRDRPGFETLERDRLAGLFAIAVGIVVDAL